MAWPGGKDGSGVVQRLINEIPPHDVFISPFLGDCAVMRRKRPATTNIGIDLDRANIERWAVGRPGVDLRLYCCCGIEWLRHAFDFYAAECGGRVPQDPAARSSVARSTFIYADPPYLLSSRRSSKRIYDHEMTDEQHAELLATLIFAAIAKTCLVMVSHYPHPLYAQGLAGWRSFTYSSQTRGGRRATEQVWCNYDPPAELHDASYLGRDKREREKIRRRVRNWSSGLARMPALERQAVLDAIASR